MTTTNNGQSAPFEERPPNEEQPVRNQHNPGTAKVADDPFDIEALRAAPPETFAVEKVLSVPVRKPSLREFFRVHPSLDFVLDCYVFEREQGFERQSWWVAPSLRDELMQDIKLVRLFTCITKRGVVFLWPARLPGADGGGNRWYETGLEAADIAKTAWVRMVASKDLGGYEILKALGDLGDPTWPDRSLRELIEIGFKGRVIDRPDHDVIRELQGAL
jgi:hypothetical protein